MATREPAAQKVVANQLPPSKPPATAPPAKTVPASPGYKPLHETVRGYTAFARERLAKANAHHGLNRSGPSAIRAQKLLDFCSGLDDFADWLEAGQPSTETILSQEERERYIWAKEHGMDIPEHIAAQLP